MDMMNKPMNDKELDEVSGGATTIIVSNNRQLVFNCVECGKKFNTEAELKQHQAETGHKLFGQRYE